jgi:hypothetical protein
MDQFIVLSEQVIGTTKHSVTTRRWIKGKHPSLGVLQVGWSGDWETIVDTTVCGKIQIINVAEAEVVEGDIDQVSSS